MRQPLEQLPESPEEAETSEDELIDMDDLELVMDQEPGADAVWNYLRELIVEIAAFSMRGGRFVADHYFIFTTGLIAAFATAMFAFFQPIGDSESGITMSQWEALPAATQAHAVINWADTLVVYTIFNSWFIELAWNKIRATLPRHCSSVGNAADSSLTLLLSVSAGTANAAISYGGYKPVVGPKLAVIPLFTTLVTITSSRFVSLGNLKVKLANLFDADLQVQKESLMQLKRMHGPLLEHMNRWLDGRDPDEQTLIEFFNELATQITAFEKRGWGEWTRKGLNVLFDTSLGLIALFSSWLIFSQKGFDGISLIASVLGLNLAEAPYFLKILLASVPGTVSSIFMTLNSVDFRHVLQDTLAYLRYHPKAGFAALLILVMNVWTALGGFRHIAFETIGPDNLFGLNDPAGILEQLYVAANVIACVPVTMPPMLKMLCNPEAPANPNPSPVTKMIFWADPARNRFSPVTVNHLRALSLFTPGASSRSEAPVTATSSRASLLGRDIQDLSEGEDAGSMLTP